MSFRVFSTSTSREIRKFFSMLLHCAQHAFSPRLRCFTKASKAFAILVAPPKWLKMSKSSVSMTSFTLMQIYRLRFCRENSKFYSKKMTHKTHSKRGKDHEPDVGNILFFKLSIDKLLRRLPLIYSNIYPSEIIDSKSLLTTLNTAKFYQFFSKTQS